LPDAEYRSKVILTDNDLKHIPKIYNDLVAEILADNETALDQQFAQLTKSLGNKNLKALRYVSKIVGAQPTFGKDFSPHTSSRTPGRITRINYAEGLTSWVYVILLDHL
jgi:hypothetical protein